MLNIINDIKEAKGNEKIEVMKAHPELKKILKYAYDPFKKYHMAAPDLDGVSFGIFEIPFYELDDISARKLSGQEAFRTICNSISTMESDTAEVFKMIINKDLRCGINIKTINKVFPGLIPLVFDGSNKPAIMLLKTFKSEKIKYPCMAAVKKDGVRARFIGGKLISRQGHLFIGFDHIEKKLKNFNHELDGELCVPGMAFDEASGLIRSHDPTPEAVYWIFDVPSINISKQHRYGWLLQNLMQSNYIRLISHFNIKSESYLMKFYKWSLDKGEEGIVTYDLNSLYEDKRSYDWMRLVPIESADCPVIGFYEGKGKHAGSLGGIIIDYKGHEVRVGTGFSEKIKKSQLNQLVTEIDKKLLTLKSKNVEGYSIGAISPAWQKIRQFIWDNKDQFLGVIAKLEFKQKTKAGSMRQPRFKTWRWDK